MKEAITQIIPYVAIGISVVIVAVDYVKLFRAGKAQKQAEMTALMNGTLTDDVPEKPEYDHLIGKGMSIGMCLGICLGAVLHFSLAMGLSVGMLGGTLLGLIVRRETK